MEKIKPLMMTIIVLLVVVLGGVGFMVYSMQGMTGYASHEPVRTEGSQMLTLAQIEKVALSQPIRTNLLSTGNAQHYVNINLAIGVNNTDSRDSPKILESLRSSEPVIRDVVLSVIRSQTFNDLSQPEGQDLLREHIKTQLQETFDSNLIVQVFISDLVFS